MYDVESESDHIIFDGRASTHWRVAVETVDNDLSLSAVRVLENMMICMLIDSCLQVVHRIHAILPTS